MLNTNDLISTYQASPSDKNFNPIFHKYKNYIKKIANSGYIAKSDIEDVICEYYLMLPSIIKSFDVTKNVDFIAFLRKCLINYHTRYVQRYNNTVMNQYLFCDIIGNNTTGILHDNSHENYVESYILYKKADKTTSDNNSDVLREIIQECEECLTEGEISVLNDVYYKDLTPEFISKRDNKSLKGVYNNLIKVYRKIRGKLWNYKVIRERYNLR